MSAPELPEDLKVENDDTENLPVDKPKRSAVKKAAVDDPTIDSPETDAAIDDIVAQEGDHALAAEDAGVAQAYQLVEDEADGTEKKRGHPVFWTIIFILVLIALLAAHVLTTPGLELPF